MSGSEIFLIYLGVGVLNVLRFGLGNFSSLAEWLFFLLLWPLQLLFRIVFGFVGWVEDHGEGWVP
jgi:hypothetical protein